ncbi:hypothetical protein [Ammoniphilus resinae]|uniref:Uncharacterized protein n=1 Tax=Ammoniphilus resinae TaxID=861532 RepID=A0ABS4GK33_9BACL|nr:hypothetical protein [Ammoniphilus resinae]MBP1930614.1 hypothetical protein [Ammoniphilus resinae]
MTYVCPLCNCLTASSPNCPKCSQPMVDQGRLMDTFDDYSPYLDIEGMKKADGYPEDSYDHQCPHIFLCLSCGEQVTQLIDEMIMA